MLFITPISASQKRTSLARLVIPGQNSCRPLSSLGRLARCSDLKNVEMLRTKAEHGHGGMHGAVRRFVAIALACLLFAGVAAGTGPDQVRDQVRIPQRSSARWLVSVGPLSVPRLQARGSGPHRL